jgi:amino acid adenylation domain-containing protein
MSHATSHGAAAAERGPLLAMFDSAVRAQPDAEALIDGASITTYAQLDMGSSAVARGLGARGVRRGDRIGLCVQRGAPAVLGILGILKAGGCYVPLDPTYPLERLRYLEEDAQLRHVVVDREAPLPHPSGAIPLEGLLDCGADAHDEAAGCPGASSEDPAYVIYTSGSTGQPKGVIVTHASLTAMLGAAIPYFGVGPADRWTLFHSYSFDFSVWELWAALVTGGTAVCVSADTAVSPDAFLALLMRERVTVLHQVPSVFRHFAAAYVRAGAPDLPLRYVICGGEPLARDPILEVTRANRRLRPVWMNIYGVTETTVHSTLRTLTKADLSATGPPSIGTALPHLTTWVLDDQQRPVGCGDVGELWMSGPGVAVGYLNRPELTARRFVSLELGRGSPLRCYRSGDLVRERADGQLEYIGRADDQIKLRGFRIELGEIEHSLRQHEQIRDAAVVAVDSAAGSRLAAAIVPRRPDAAPTASDLRAFLSERLPAHMVPNWVVQCTGLPQTPTGKLDRRAVRSLVGQDRPGGAGQ